MPLYVYGCPECEIELEERRPAWRADDPVECPVCHGLCTRELSRFHAHIQNPEALPLASPPLAAHAAHSPACDCCHPSRRAR